VAPEPEPPEAIVAPPSPAAPAAAPVPSAPEEPEAEPRARTERHERKKHKRRKNRGGDPGGEREPAPELDPRASDSGTLVFSSAGGSLQVKGRVFALAELQHRSETVVNTSGGLTTRDVNSLDFSLASARFGIEYRSPLRWLSAELELEIADRPEVKDAFILAGKRLFAKAGQFKLPTAALELESPWTLPLVRRGLVHDLLTDWLDVAGRRPGLALGYRGKGGLKPRLTLGAFQGTTMTDVVPGDRDVALIEKASLKAQSLAARAELRLAMVDVGAWYEHRVGSKVFGEFSHFPTFGLDATVDQTFDGGGLRVVVDGGGGQSHYEQAHKQGVGEEPLYLFGRDHVG
jgi:hypothetical protein